MLSAESSSDLLSGPALQTGNTYSVLFNSAVICYLPAVCQGLSSHP